MFLNDRSDVYMKGEKNNPFSTVRELIEWAVEAAVLQKFRHFVEKLFGINLTSLKNLNLYGCFSSQEPDTCIKSNMNKLKWCKDAEILEKKNDETNQNETNVSLPKFDLLLSSQDTDICISNGQLNETQGSNACLSKTLNTKTTDLDDESENGQHQTKGTSVNKILSTTEEHKQRLLLLNETTDTICISLGLNNTENENIASTEMHERSSSNSSIAGKGEDKTSSYKKPNSEIKSEIPLTDNRRNTSKTIRSRTRNTGRNTCSYSRRQRTRKALMPNMLLILYTCTTEALPLFYKPNVTEPAKLLSENIIMSDTCSYQKFACPLEERNFAHILTQCGFIDRCRPDYKPICINVAGLAKIFCSPRNLTCEPGFHRRAMNDESKSDTVIIFEERCSAGTYQSAPSDCYKACQNNHRHHLPHRYLVYSPGDHINPTFVYCNYRIGYYNSEGRFLLDFDEAEEHDNLFCNHVNKSDPCKSGQFPLPNGTCVSQCSPEDFRDDFDGFVCKSKISNTQEFSRRPELPTHSPIMESVREESILISTSASGMHREGPLPDWTTFNSSLEENPEKNMDWWRSNAQTVTIVAVLVAVLVIIGIVIVFAHMLKTGRWFWCSRTSNGTGSQQGHTTEYLRVRTNETNNVNCTYTNINGENIVIHINNSSMTIGNSDDTGVSLHGSDLQENSLSDGPDGNGGSPESGLLLHDHYELQESVEQQSLASEGDETPNKDVRTDTPAQEWDKRPSCAIEMDETQTKEVDFDTPVQGRNKPTAKVQPLKPQDYNTTMMDLKEWGDCL